ncbi:hypothetical protein GQ53DRAFT_369728 [Thozetella sp. PMI_491]|nr:hypothetical protein GQ53DRAFT_369728 [Thozetella sp. PMI_491]
MCVHDQRDRLLSESVSVLLFAMVGLVCQSSPGAMYVASPVCTYSGGRGSCGAWAGRPTTAAAAAATQGGNPGLPGSGPLGKAGRGGARSRRTSAWDSADGRVDRVSLSAFNNAGLMPAGRGEALPPSGRNGVAMPSRACAIHALYASGQCCNAREESDRGLIADGCADWARNMKQPENASGSENVTGTGHSAQQATRCVLSEVW